MQREFIQQIDQRRDSTAEKASGAGLSTVSVSARHSDPLLVMPYSCLVSAPANGTEIPPITEKFEPTPDKSSYRNVTFGRFPHSDNPVYQEL
jgi:hypothetical protein